MILVLGKEEEREGERRGAGEGRGEEEGRQEERGGREGGGKDNVHEYVMNVVFFFKTFLNVRSSDRF